MAVRKKPKRPSSRHGARASTIHEWACKTMGYQEDAFPAKDLLIQAAGGPDVWEFITKHIRQTSTADSIRDNLLLHTGGGTEGGEWSELKMAESQVDQLNREVDSLHVATEQLQQDVEQLQADIRDTDHAGRTAQSNIDELQCQSAILTASYHHSLEHVNVLHEYTARLSNRPIGLHKSSTSSSSTRVVPASCIVEVNETHTQVQHLLELMNTSTHSKDMEKAKQQAWTTVEGLLGARSGPNILSALTITTAQNTREVREMTEQLNLKRDVEELRYSYNSMGELTDEAIQPSVLHTVEEHIREAQLNHVEQSLQAEHTHQAASHSKELLIEAQRNWEELVAQTYRKDDVSLAHETMLMEMELCGSQAALVTVTNLCKELKNRQQQKNEEMRRLEEKHKQISQFRDMMEAKQSSMRSLIKHNSAAKHCLLSQQTEVGLYIKQHICSHQAEMSLLVTALNGAVTNEVTMSSPKLASLRTVSDLSVHRLLPRCSDAPDLLPLLILLGLHHLSSPDELLQKCITNQRKVKAFRKETALLEEVLTEMTQQSLTEEHLGEAASTLKQCQDNQRESVSLLSNSLSLSSQTMAVCPEVEQIIAEWWEQPAMKLVHWVKVEDMSLEQWLDQWRVLAASYRQLHCS